MKLEMCDVLISLVAGRNRWKTRHAAEIAVPDHDPLARFPMSLPVPGSSDKTAVRN